MWPYYGIIALDLARERARDAERAAVRARLAREAAEARRSVQPAQPGALRRLAATPLRAFSDVTHAVSEVACSAATRIEGRTA